MYNNRDNNGGSRGNMGGDSYGSRGRGGYNNNMGGDDSSFGSNMTRGYRGGNRGYDNNRGY